MTNSSDPFWRERRSATDGDWATGRPLEPLEPTPRDEIPGREAPRPGGPSRWAPLAWATFGALLGGAVAGLAVALLLPDDDDAVRSGEAGASSTTALTVKQDDAIIQVAARARPGIVRIESSRRTTDGVVSDVGSGVILDKEGHILTNAHVVLGTETLKVFLADGSERPAILIGHDAPFTDLAVLQIGPTGLTPIEVGDSAALVLGQSVVAIGNPLAEFDGSVSVGVVSGINRTRVLDGVRQDDMIQTDAAVNSGNSGGALLNLQGQLVGIPTVVIRQSRTSQPVEGIAFALPANRAVAIARSIIEANGNYPRPAMGIEHLDITENLPVRFSRLPVSEGAVVAAVQPGGPAAQAGIAVGDVITRIGDAPVDEEHPFLNGLMAHSAGDTVKVVLNRNGRIIEADVRLGARS